MTLLRPATWSRRDAALVLRLVEEIEWCLDHARPMPLETFVAIHNVRAVSIENQERAARRLHALLRDLGYELPVRGKRERLELDFAEDKALHRVVRNLEDRALAMLTGRNAFPISAFDGNSSAIAADRTQGLTVRSLRRRYRTSWAKLLSILGALKRRGACPTPPSRKPRVEELRSPMVVARALALPRGRGYYARMARILGCDWHTARALDHRRETITYRNSVPRDGT